VAPDLGLGYLQKVCEKKGHECHILDGLLDPVSPEGLASTIAENGYQVVGLKVYSNVLSRLSSYLSCLKSSCPDVVTVLGGPHPSAVGKDISLHIPEAAFAMAGEGEKGFTALLEVLQGVPIKKGWQWDRDLDPDLAIGVPGLIWGQDGTVRCNPAQAVEDLDQLDAPAWNRMNLERYLRFITPIRNAPNVPLLTSRGCPYQCTYCAGHYITGRGVRFRSPTRVVEEMLFLNSGYGIDTFAIVDDNFTLRGQHVESFCTSLEESGCCLKWDCLATGVRLDTLHKELLERMEEAGCKAMSVAVESGSQRILEDMRKQVSLDTIREKIRLIKETTRIKVNSYYILGYPEETREDINMSIRFACSSATDFAQFFLFTPLPGTEITQRLLKDGRLTEVDWASFHFDKPSVTLKDVSLQELKGLQRKAYLTFYLRPRTLYRVFRSLNSFASVKDLASRTLAMVGREPLERFGKWLAYANPWSIHKR